MIECLDSDKLLTIGQALDWDVESGLRHLEHCDECRARLEGLRLTREALVETEDVEPEAIRRISAALSDAARIEKRDTGEPSRWASAIEPLVAGVTALVVLTSSGIRIASLAAGVLAFALGATLLLGGRKLARRVPALTSP
ncbi:MAG TPA: hypothetical protein VMM18_12870 [Gemmatimonadaceae bacterium]|nr:hypothetical protein [Gemmatimonadaceae bacterium]